ncbi:MAG: GIY-YIG nuclease family protein [Geobacter sp.]|nr:MAG: GIY-YIG nuclease family protein [Geobacter sp.]
MNGKKILDRLAENVRENSPVETATLTTWHVYIILCSDNSLYAGITTDIDRRFGEHATGKGAKYFRIHRPKMLFYLEGGHSRSTAGKREIEIKRMKHSEKQRLAASARNEAAGHPFRPTP